MEDLIRELQCIKRDGSWAASVRLRDQHPVCRKAATALAERDAELAAKNEELARMRDKVLAAIEGVSIANAGNLKRKDKEWEAYNHACFDCHSAARAALTGDRT